MQISSSYEIYKWSDDYGDIINPKFAWFDKRNMRKLLLKIFSTEIISKT